MIPVPAVARTAVLLVASAIAACHAAPGTGPAAAALGNAARCRAYDGLPPGFGRDAHAGMQHLPGGDFELGSTRGYAEERPVVRAHAMAFWIDRTEVTNAQFAAFVAATGYVTTAERSGGAAVFHSPSLADLHWDGAPWWRLDPRADWRHPDGAAGSLQGRMNQPVVDVSFADAQAYAAWLGHRLPTEAEWEYAAKAGRDDAQADAGIYAAAGPARANVWQGMFPFHDSGADGYAGRAPVGCFAANPFGLQDMIGNVWEWTTDRYRDGHGPQAKADGDTDRRVIKGGSYLCAASYCARARAASRQGQEADLPTDHIGFRTVVSG